MTIAWYYKRKSEELGPFTSQQLKELATNNSIATDTLIRRGLEGKWVPAQKVKGLFNHPPDVEQPVPDTATATSEMGSQPAVESDTDSNGDYDWAPAPECDAVDDAPLEPPPLPAVRSEYGSQDFVSASGDEKIDVVQSAEYQNTRIEVLEYQSLDGCRDVQGAQAIYFANRSGVRLKQVRIELGHGGSAVLEAGALHYMHGTIEMESGKEGLKRLGKAVANRMLAGETAFRPKYSGVGAIYLEPSFSHFILSEMQGETLIVDKGMFYCCTGEVEVGVALQKNISSGLFGGEGWFQTKVSGHGLCVLESPVPFDEVRCIELNNEMLQVDGNFALMRTSGVTFNVQKSSRGIIRTLTSGEGLLQTFQGTGKVWIAPTQAVYDAVARSGLSQLSEATHRSKTTT